MARPGQRFVMGSSSCLALTGRYHISVFCVNSTNAEFFRTNPENRRKGWRVKGLKIFGTNRKKAQASAPRIIFSSVSITRETNFSIRYFRWLGFRSK
jgi:hypothetical protein